MKFEELTEPARKVCLDLCYQINGTSSGEFIKIADDFHPDRLCAMVVGYAVGKGLTAQEAYGVWKVFRGSPYIVTLIKDKISSGLSLYLREYPDTVDVIVHKNSRAVEFLSLNKDQILNLAQSNQVSLIELDSRSNHRRWRNRGSDRRKSI